MREGCIGVERMITDKQRREAMDSGILFDVLEQTAKQLVEAHGEHPPMFIFPDAELNADGKRGIEIKSVQFEDDVDKEMACAVVKQKVEQNGYDEYFSIMDGWVLPKKKMDALKKQGVDLRSLRPSQYPGDRVSCIVIVHYHRIHGMDMRTFTYKGVEGKKNVWKASKTMKHALDKSGVEAYNRFNIWNKRQVTL
jgi:hypothetical protein